MTLSIPFSLPDEARQTVFQGNLFPIPATVTIRNTSANPVSLTVDSLDVGPSYQIEVAGGSGAAIAALAVVMVVVQGASASGVVEICTIAL